VIDASIYDSSIKNSDQNRHEKSPSTKRKGDTRMYSFVSLEIGETNIQGVSGT
jgi:hypothetical protein